MATKRGIVFDFDGVIADSWSLHEQAWRETLKSFDSGLPEDVLKATLGSAPQETAERFISELGINVSPQTLSDAKEVRLTALFEEAAPMMGAEAAIRRMCQDFPVAIVSVHPSKLIARALKRFGLEGVAPVVLTIDDVRPDAALEDLYVRAAAELQFEPDQIVVIDDSRNGILAAKRLGMNTIAFDSNPRHEIDYSMADAQIRSLDELVPELVNLVTAT